MPTPAPPYKDIIVTTRNRIGTIKFNRPSSLNAFGGNLIPETIQAIRDLDSDPDTVFTVLTGEGRFFSAGADVREGSLTSGTKEEFKSVAEKKLAFLHRFTPALELLRSIISHRKVFVLALNGPAVGGGAAWFAGVVDIILAAKDAYLQVPFSALGLVPENGSAVSFAQSIGVHRANDFLMFGRKLTAEALESWGLVNRIFAKETFHDDVERFLREMLELNDGRSMMEMKRLQNERLKGERMLAVYQSMDALAERFIDGAPFDRFEARRKELEEKSRKRSKL